MHHQTLCFPIFFFHCTIQLFPSALHFSLHITVFRSHVCKELNTNIMDLNKKRKLQAELLEWPSRKHKCWGRSFSSQIVHPLDGDTEIDDLHTPTIKETDGETLDDGSETDSAKDSNSFAGDLDSVLSVYGEAKFEPECEKTFPYSHPYSSYVNWRDNSSGDNLDSLKSTTRVIPDVSKDKPTRVRGEHNPLVSQNIEEQLLEFGNDVYFMSSKHGDEMMEHSTDKELADIPYFGGTTSNNYVLSSGRWSVNQGNLHMTLNTFGQDRRIKKCHATCDLQVQGGVEPSHLCPPHCCCTLICILCHTTVLSNHFLNRKH